MVLPPLFLPISFFPAYDMYDFPLLIYSMICLLSFPQYLIPCALTYFTAYDKERAQFLVS